MFGPTDVLFLTHWITVSAQLLSCDNGKYESNSNGSNLKKKLRIKEVLRWWTWDYERKIIINKSKQTT